MNEAVAVFQPNKAISKNTFRLLVITEAVIFFIVWASTHFTLLPNFGEVLSSFHDLWFNEGLADLLLTSFMTNLQAIGIAVVISLILSYSIVFPFMRPVVTMISKLRFLSLAGLTFVFTLATSNGHQLKVALLTFSVSVFFVTSMVDVLDDIPMEKYDLARTLRFSEWQVTWEVIILGRIDYAFDVLRQNAAIGWMMLTMVESMVRSEGGVGVKLATENRLLSHLPMVLAIQITILLTGLGQDYMIGVLKNLFCPYAKLTRRK